MPVAENNDEDERLPIMQTTSKAYSTRGSSAHGTPRLSVPAPGRTIVNTLRPWISKLAEAHGYLTESFRTKEASLEERFSPVYLTSNDQLGGSVPRSELPALASGALLSTWLVRNSVSPGQVGIAECEEWFNGSTKRLLSNLLQASTLYRVHEALHALPSGPVLEDVTPYLMEVFDSQIVKAGRDPIVGRMAKRLLGLFYTPSDVAQFIATWALAAVDNLKCIPDCLDPACGTAILLRAAFDALTEATGKPRLEVCRHLYGLDVSPHSVQAATFVLLSRCLSPDSTEAPVHSWRRIHENFAVRDSTIIASEPRLVDGLGQQVTAIQELFPRVENKFHVVLGNPPYNTLPNDSHQHVRKQIFVTASTMPAHGGPAYPLFVEMMWRFTREDSSAAGMVVPLSVAYHSGAVFSMLRREMLTAGASWRFHFFDRTPDSLFGDHVKTRNAIIFMQRRRGAAQELLTSPLHRWNSRNRDMLFTRLPSVRLSNHSIGPFIPKFGSELEETAYDLLQRRRKIASLGRQFKPSEVTAGSDRDVFRYSTAYNWLPCFRVIPECYDSEGRAIIPDSISGIRFDSPDVAAFVFAVLSARVTYWLWRVEGDGFHLPHSFIRRLPFHPSQLSAEGFGTMARLGADLWEELRHRPVFATNGGVTTCNFSPVGSEHTIDQVDRLLVRELGLPTGLETFVKGYQAETIEAGRERKRPTTRRDP